MERAEVDLRHVIDRACAERELPDRGGAGHDHEHVHDLVAVTVGGPVPNTWSPRRFRASVTPSNDTCESAVASMP